MARLLLMGLLFVAVVAAGCSAAPTTDDTPAGDQVSIEDFPVGVGRGFATAAVAGDPQPGQGLQPGAPAPGFALQLDDGRFTTLDALKGRPVVINFWATWCGPCRLEMPELVAVAAANPELVLLGANVQETRAQVEPFAAEFAMNFPVLLDPDGRLRQLYQVRGLPMTFFVDREGRIASIYAGALTPAALQERLAAITAR